MIDITFYLMKQENKKNYIQSIKKDILEIITDAATQITTSHTSTLLLLVSLFVRFVLPAPVNLAPSQRLLLDAVQQIPMNWKL